MTPSMAKLLSLCSDSLAPAPEEMQFDTSAHPALVDE